MICMGVIMEMALVSQNLEVGRKLQANEHG